MTYLNAAQIIRASQENPYLLLRYSNGEVLAVNSRVAKIAQRIKPVEPAKTTRFVSFRPCSLNEYINNKEADCLTMPEK